MYAELFEVWKMKKSTKIIIKNNKQTKKTKQKPLYKHLTN